jgi:hypothetical protein
MLQRKSGLDLAEKAPKSEAEYADLLHVVKMERDTYAERLRASEKTCQELNDMLKSVTHEESTMIRQEG